MHDLLVFPDKAPPVVHLSSSDQASLLVARRKSAFEYTSIEAESGLLRCHDKKRKETARMVLNESLFR